MLTVTPGSTAPLRIRDRAADAAVDRLRAE